MGAAPSNSAPYGAQINTIPAGLRCLANQNPNISSDTFFTLTAPLSAGAGSSIYFTDFTARFVIDSFFTGAAKVYRSDYYQANITLNFDVTNASPSTYSITENNITHNWTYPYLDFPVSGLGVMPPFGPFKVGASGRVDFKLRSIDALIRLAKSSDPSYEYDEPPNTVVCNEQPLPILASVVIDKSAPAVLAPANNAKASLPQSMLGLKTTSANIPVICKHDGGTQYSPDWNYTFTASAPIIYLGQAPFNITNVTNSITVPGNVIAALTGSSQGGTCGVFLDVLPQNGVPGLLFNLSYATPTSLDASTNFIASDPSTPKQLSTGRYVDCGSSTPVTFPIPNLGYLDIPNVAVVNQTGPVFALDIKNVGGTVSGVNSKTGITTKQVWVCTPKSSVALLTAPLQVPPCVACQGDGCPPYSCPN